MSKILRLLHTATFGIALVLISINAQAELFRVALSTKDFGYLPLYVGIRSGLFAQEGLEIQWIVINSNVVVTALIAGEIDVAGIAGSSMRAVARGEKPAPADAARPSFESVEALIRLLTPENRRLLAIIRDRKPQSINELAEMTGRAAPNLTRTLAKLEAVGFVRMHTVERRKVPMTVVHRLHVEIDPFSQNDRFEIA